MKSLFFLLALLISPPASAQDCGQVRCYDECLQQEVVVQGDTCGRSWATTGCFRAIGSCRRSPRPACALKYCYDQCTGAMIGLRVNQRTQIFDYTHGCYRAGGNCL